MVGILQYSKYKFIEPFRNFHFVDVHGQLTGQLTHPLNNCMP